MRTLALTAGIIAALEILKWTLGQSVALTVALAALAFCIGAVWGAGETKQRLNAKEPAK